MRIDLATKIINTLANGYRVCPDLLNFALLDSHLHLNVSRVGLQDYPAMRTSPDVVYEAAYRLL